VASQTLDTLAQLLDDPNLLIVKVVVSCLTTVYPLLFRLLCELCVFNPYLHLWLADVPTTAILLHGPHCLHAKTAFSASYGPHLPAMVSGFPQSSFCNASYYSRHAAFPTPGYASCLSLTYSNPSHSSRTRMIPIFRYVPRTIPSSRLPSSKQRVRNCLTPS
jgi:hypothetical protein